MLHWNTKKKIFIYKELLVKVDSNHAFFYVSVYILCIVTNQPPISKPHVPDLKILGYDEMTYLLEKAHFETGCESVEDSEAGNTTLKC